MRGGRPAAGRGESRRDDWGGSNTAVSTAITYEHQKFQKIKNEKKFIIYLIFTHTKIKSMEELKEETTSRPNHLKLISLEVDAYAGLNMVDKAMVVHFPENDRITEFSGDQGVGKTSLMNGLKALMGELEPGNSVNAVSGNKSATLTFEKDGNKYQARLTKTAFTLKNMKEDANGKIVTSTISKPKDIIADLIGPVGVSPTFLSKKKSGEEQIEWIKSLAGNNPEIAKAEAEIQKGYDAAYKERTIVNADVQRLSREIEAQDFYSWDAENKVFTATPARAAAADLVNKSPGNEDEIKNTYEKELARDRDLERAKNKLQEYTEKDKAVEDKISSLENQILLLQSQVSQEKLAKESLKESMAKGAEYIKTLEDAPTKLKESQEAMQNSGKIAIAKKSIEDIDALVHKYKIAEDTQQALNNKLVEYNKLMQNLAKDSTPDIEGLEVVIGNIDSKHPAGVYFKGVNIAALSESELWDLCLQIWKFTGTSVVYIENSTSLGTDAIHRVNWFAKNGGHVFISTMQRGYKELKVSFHKEKE